MRSFILLLSCCRTEGSLKSFLSSGVKNVGPVFNTKRFRYIANFVAVFYLYLRPDIKHSSDWNLFTTTHALTFTVPLHAP